MQEKKFMEDKQRRQNTRQGGDSHKSTKHEENQPHTDFNQAPRGRQ